MRLVAAAEPAVLAQLQPLARLLLVLGRAVVAPLTFRARQGDDVSHCSVPCQLPTPQLPTPNFPAAWELGRWELTDSLFDNLRDRAGAHRAAAFTNREARALLERDRDVQFRGNRGVVPRHH